MKVSQSCLILCYPLNSRVPGSSVHGIPQARILEWLAVPFSRGSSKSRDGTQISHITGGFFTIWTTREASNNLRSLNFIMYKISPQTFWLQELLIHTKNKQTNKQTKICWLQRALLYLVGYLKYVVSVVKIKTEKMLK